MKSFGLLGANIHFGQRHKGVADACDLIRKSISEYSFVDFGNVAQPLKTQTQKVYRDLYFRTLELTLSVEFPLIIGGDHSIGYSTTGAILSQNSDLGVIWVDAHADINTPQTSMTHNLHGMPIAGLLQLFDAEQLFGVKVPKLKPEQIVYVGTRDLDPGEIEFLAKYKIRFYSIDEVRAKGIARVLAEAAILLGQGPLHISFDLDSVCPKITNATGVPVPGGLKWNDIIEISQFIRSCDRVRSLELVELDPYLAQSSQDLFASIEIFKRLIEAFYLGRHRNTAARQITFPSQSSDNTPGDCPS